MSRKALPAQVRGQRISHPDLVKEARATLSRLGANNRLRAEFVSELAKVVVPDDQPILCQQHPKVRPVQDKFWKYAFLLVRDYLAENDLQLTEQTAEVEFPEFSTQYSGLTSVSSSEGFQRVLEQQSDRSFAERVDDQISGAKGNVHAVEETPVRPGTTDGQPTPAPAEAPGGRLTKRRSAAPDGDKPAPKGKGKAAAKGAKVAAKAQPSKAPAKSRAALKEQPPAQLPDEGDASSGSFGE
jgi:hypothetical protein